MAVNIVSSDVTEGKPSAASLTFTSTNWSTTQTVTITGRNDFDQDGDVEYIVSFEPSSADSLYNGTSGVQVSLTNSDNESPEQAPSITRQPTSQAVTAGGTASFSVLASGSANLNYQWNFNGKPITG